MRTVTQSFFHLVSLPVEDRPTTSTNLRVNQPSQYHKFLRTYTRAFSPTPLYPLLLQSSNCSILGYLLPLKDIVIRRFLQFCCLRLWQFSCVHNRLSCVTWLSLNYVWQKRLRVAEHNKPAKKKKKKTTCCRQHQIRTVYVFVTSTSRRNVLRNHVAQSLREMFSRIAINPF